MKPFNSIDSTKRKNQSLQVQYIPWRDESSDLGRYMDFRCHEDKIDDILENEKKYTQSAIKIEAIMICLNVDHPSIHETR